MPCPCLGVTSCCPRALGDPSTAHLRGAATIQPQHDGWAMSEPCQVDDPAQKSPGSLPGVLSCPHTAAVPQEWWEHCGTADTPVHTCAPGIRPGSEARSSAREPALILVRPVWSSFKTKITTITTPALHRNEKWMYLKKGKAGKAGTGQSSDTRLVTCSIPVTNKHHALVGQVFRLHYPQVSLHESETTGTAVWTAGFTLNSKELITQPHWQPLSKRLKNFALVQSTACSKLPTFNRKKKASLVSYQSTVFTTDFCHICNLLVTILTHQWIVRPIDKGKIQRIRTVMSPREVIEVTSLEAVQFFNWSSFTWQRVEVTA